MSGWGKYVVKYDSRQYDCVNKEEMSFDFSGCSDVGTFEIKGKDSSMWGDGKEYGEKYYFNIDQLEQMYLILKKFKEEY
jgi:hypothetical protein